MDPVTCQRAQVTRDAAVGSRVGDVMLRTPKTLPGRATVADAQAFFDNPKVISAVLVDGTAFAGLLDRSDVPSLLDGALPVRTFVKRELPVVTPDVAIEDAMAILDERGLARLVVLDDDGVTLAGLLCLDLARAGFCQG